MVDAMPVEPLPAALPTLLVLASTYPRWHGDPEPGFVHELSKRLIDQFRVIVLCPHAPGALLRERMDGVEVVRYRYAPQRWETLVNEGGIVTNLRRNNWKYLLVPGFLLAQVWCAWRLVRTRRVDVMHAHWLIPQGLIAALMQLLPGRKVPFIVTAHGSDVNVVRGGVLDVLKRHVLRSAKIATAVSDDLRNSLLGLGGHGAEVHVQPMGVDLKNRFTPDHVEREKNQILFVGRLVPGKGVDHLIRAMPLVLARTPGARLVVVGHGPESATLEALVAELGLTACVSFRGAITQELLPEFYRRASLFVAPFGMGEGFGLVLVEAIGCSCPIIANNVPAALYILEGDSDWLTADCGNHRALADRIALCLDDPGRSQRGIERVRSRMVSRFDWEIVAGRYANFLEEARGRWA